MPFSHNGHGPKSAVVAYGYCAKPPQQGCGGSSGTPKEKTTTAAVAAVATATAAVLVQVFSSGAPQATAAHGSTGAATASSLHPINTKRRLP